MSNLTLFQKTESLIMAQAKKFVELASSHKAVNFAQEANFALQALRANKYLGDTALANPDSLIAAVHNIASIGLSLNPALKHAYLVPRDGVVCLDIGYKGLVHLAVDAGAILYAQPELDYKKDKFKRLGRNQEPQHIYEPFNDDRGEVVGAYCIAEIANDKFLTETMTYKQVMKIRDKTQGYKAHLKAKAKGEYKSCIWVTDEDEMIKKTVIRRASKGWPMSNASRFERAIELTDQVDPVDVTPVSVEVTPQIEGPNPKFQEIRDLLAALPREESAFLEYVSGVNKRKIEKIEDLSEVEIKSAIIQLKSWASAAPKKEEPSANT